MNEYYFGAGVGMIGSAIGMAVALIFGGDATYALPVVMIFGGIFCIIRGGM